MDGGAPVCRPNAKSGSYGACSAEGIKAQLKQAETAQRRRLEDVEHELETAKLVLYNTFPPGVCTQMLQMYRGLVSHVQASAGPDDDSSSAAAEDGLPGGARGAALAERAAHDSGAGCSSSATPPERCEGSGAGGGTRAPSAGSGARGDGGAAAAPLPAGQAAHSALRPVQPGAPQPQRPAPAPPAVAQGWALDFACPRLERQFVQRAHAAARTRDVTRAALVFALLAVLALAFTMADSGGFGGGAAAIGGGRGAPALRALQAWLLQSGVLCVLFGAAAALRLPLYAQHREALAGAARALLALSALAFCFFAGSGGGDGGDSGGGGSVGDSGGGGGGGGVGDGSGGGGGLGAPLFLGAALVLPALALRVRWALHVPLQLLAAALVLPLVTAPGGGGGAPGTGHGGGGGGGALLLLPPAAAAAVFAAAAVVAPSALLYWVEASERAAFLQSAQ